MSEDQQIHLPVVDAICPDGHKTGTQKPSGSRVKCSRCAQDGEAVMLIVPDRPGPALRPAPRQVPAALQRTSYAAETAQCCTCRTTAPRPGEKLLPVGWLSLMAGANPAADRYGRTRVYHGPYCSARCAIAALEAADRGAEVNVSHLMTMKPSGSDR